MVWLKLLQPWNTGNAFVEAAILADLAEKPGFQTFKSYSLGFDVAPDSSKSQRPNVELFEKLSVASLSKLQGQVTAFDTKSKALSHSWPQYIDDFSLFYFDLLTKYLICLDQQAEYDAEDIQVFKLIMELYQLRSPTAPELDLTKPKELYLIDGFLTHQHFEALLRKG